MSSRKMSEMLPMLYDPKKWKVNISDRLLSLESLVAFLATKPANRTYLWGHPDRCALGQWLRAIRFDKSLIVKQSCDFAQHQPFEYIALTPPYTFGAALERARAALASEDK